MAVRGITIGDYISNYKSQAVCMDKFFLKELMTDDSVKLIYVSENILASHDKFLDTIKVSYTMSDEEFRKYQYNPWRMSEALYSTTELWFLLLHANEMYSASEFNKRTVNVYKDNIIEKISEIIGVENDFISDNTTEIFNQRKALDEGTYEMWN